MSATTKRIRRPTPKAAAFADPLLGEEDVAAVVSQQAKKAREKEESRRQKIVAQREAARLRYSDSAIVHCLKAHRLGRGLTDLATFAILGFKPISGLALHPAFAEQPAQLGLVWPRGGHTRLQVLQAILGGAVLEEAILPVVNRNLKNTRGSVAIGERSRYDAVNPERWWSFFGRELQHRLAKHGKAPSVDTSGASQLPSNTDKHRHTAIRNAHKFAEDDIRALQKALREALLQLIQLGNYGVVDETMFAYTGHDMRTAGHAMNIPRKPHPYGLLLYGLVQQLLRSEAPILIDFEPRLPSSRPAGGEALRLLAARNFAGRLDSTHIYADNLFTATRQVAEFRRTGPRVTISFGENATADLRELKARATPDLGMGAARTFSCPSAVAQLTGGNEHPTCVFTTFWHIPRGAEQPPQHNARYKIATALFRCDATDAEIAEFLHVNPAQHMGDRVSLLREALGVDLSLPEPGPQGVLLTKENLKELGKERLRILHSRTPGCSGASGRKVDALIKDILAHHPLAKTPSAVDAWLAADRTVEAVTAELLGPQQQSPIATAAYQAKYGLLDRLDRALYVNFGTNYYRSWETCFVMSILFQQVLNAHSLYREQVLCVAANKAGKRSTTNDDEWSDTVASFVLDIIKALH